MSIAIALSPIVGYHGTMCSHDSVSFGITPPGAMPPFGDMTSVSQPLTEP